MSEAKTKSSERSEKPKSVDLHSPARERSLATQEGFGLMDVRQTAGNLALQRLFRAGAIKAKLTISQPHDSEEQEADLVADRIMRMEDPALTSSLSGVIHRKCAACEADSGPCPSCAEEKIRRKENAGRSSQQNALPHSQIIGLRGSGEPLSPSVRSFYEPRFGRDLGHVRVHIDESASQAAGIIGARAFTLGSNIAFARDQFAPQTPGGKRLLAHELTHVVQQRGTPTLRRSPDLRKQSIGADFARDLSEMELERQASVLKAYLATPGRYEGEAYTEYWTAKENLTALEDEQRARVLRLGGFGGPGPAAVPRPPGLPLDGGYRLQELPGLPADLAAQIPEGQLVTLPAGALEEEQPAGRRPSLTPGLAGGSWAGLRGANAALMNFGLASAGETAIGLVAIPPKTLTPWDPHFNLAALEMPLESAGHTAVYVRQGGQITMVRGYNPRLRLFEPSTWDVVTKTKLIFSTNPEVNKIGVPGEITSDAGLFRSAHVRTVEYPVTPDVAAELVRKMPPLGTPVPGEPPLYTAPPSLYATQKGGPVGCTATNCGLWATQKIEGPLGARVGIAGEPPIVDIPVPGQAAQGKLYGMMDPARMDPGRSLPPLVEMPNATGSPRIGGVSTGLFVLKWGGRIFLVYGLWDLGRNIKNAPEGERGHVAFVGGMGFAGGFAAGAALGLVCGPGAPVCSVVTGIAGGIVGAIAGSELGEALWNFPEDLKQAVTTAGEIVNELEERKVQELVRKSGGTMPLAVQDAARSSGIAIFFAD